MLKISNRGDYRTEFLPIKGALRVSKSSKKKNEAGVRLRVLIIGYTYIMSPSRFPNNSISRFVNFSFL